MGMVGVRVVKKLGDAVRVVSLPPAPTLHILHSEATGDLLPSLRTLLNTNSVRVIHTTIEVVVGVRGRVWTLVWAWGP